MPDVQVLERVLDPESIQSDAPVTTFPPSNLPTEDGELQRELADLQARLRAAEIDAGA